MSDRAYDRNRLKSLVHYVIWAAGAHPKFGATKLNKIAWFSDARRFVLSGQSITGSPYLREKHGPVPRDIMIVREELVREGAIRQWKDKVYDREKWCFRALTTPPVNVFSADEKSMIDHWVKTITENHTAESISDLSHDYGWEIAKMGERLPFVSILAERAREPNDEELRWAKNKAAELGLI